MNPFALQSYHPGPIPPVSQALLVLAVVAVAWALHSRRLHAQRRDLMLLVERQTGEWRKEADAHARLRRWVDSEGERLARRQAIARGQDAPATAEPVEPATVLAVAPASTRAVIASHLQGLPVAIAAADSAWSARVACRDAFDAGRPYNLVLLDASLAEAQEPDQPGRLQEDLEAWGTRVAVLRAPAVEADESIQCDENPDRGGRTGFAAAARADAAAMGLRGGGRD